MAKDRIAVTCNGRSAFYACMYEDIRQCAMDCGWAVALHGSLASDMDIMAMPWVENSTSFKDMVDKISKLFKDNDVSSQYVITYNEKPHNRVVATIPIFADFYLDISTIFEGVNLMRDRLIELSTLTPVEILNYFRNLYYNDGNNTERGIVANAINDILPRMILPPCKAGDTVYVRNGKSGTVTSIHQNLVGKEVGRWVVTAWFENYYGDTEIAGFECGANKTFYFADFGKTVFLTREEAEAAIAERNKEV